MKTIQLDSLDTYKLTYLAQSFDFTSQYLAKKIRENNLDVEKDKKAYVLNKKQVLELAALLDIEISFSEPNDDNPKDNNNDDELVRTLRTTLDALTRQLDAKDKQIERLNEIINSISAANKTLSESNKALAANAAVHTAADKKEILTTETAIAPVNQRSFLDKLKDLFR